MPDIICTTVYQFPELSDAAKEKARRWYREAAFHDDWWDVVYDDFERICDILGVSLKRRSVRLMGAAPGRSPASGFRGFRHKGTVLPSRRRLDTPMAPREIRAYAPQDQILHGIADRLQAAQRQNFYQLSADVTHRGRYYHEYCMSIDVSRDSPTGQPPTAGSEETVVETLRDLARWLYRQLEAEYDHLTSDEAVEEGIVINEYTFTEGGRRFG